MRPSFFPNLAPCIWALHPTYYIFSQIWMPFALYVVRPTYMKSTPGQTAQPEETYLQTNYLLAKPKGPSLNYLKDFEAYPSQM